MSNFAQINNQNIVLQVLVIEQTEIDTGNWGNPSSFVQTSYNTRGGIYYIPNSYPPAPIRPVTNTVLLLNMTDAAVTDSSMQANLSTVGDARSLSTTIKKYNSSLMYFDGTGDYLITSSTLHGQLGTSDFTIEYWDNHGTQGTNYAPQVGTLSSAAIAATWRLGTFSNSGGLYFTYHNGTAYQDAVFGTATYNDNTWRHFAAVRKSGVLTAYVNGVQVGTTATLTQNFNSTNRISVGAELISPTYFTGYIDDLRITYGVARYVTNFTPPTTPPKLR